MDLNIDEIKKQFIDVISFSQGMPEGRIDVDDLFDAWYVNKKAFIDLMGGKLYYEFPEEYTVTIDKQKQKDKAFDFARHVAIYYGNYQLSRFIESNYDSFFKNSVEQLTEDAAKKGVVMNMKLSKAFKFFEEDPVSLRAIQDKASTIIQEGKVSGRLRISVHPLDYLSLSQNAHNWRSCHSLDGEYRAGNLSYMADPSTVVCYLCSGEDNLEIPRMGNVKWNSKKWRMLLHFSDNVDFVINGRQYPFKANEIVNDIMDLMNIHLFQPYSNFNNSMYGYGQWTHWAEGIDTFKLQTLNNDEEREVGTSDYYIYYEKRLIPLESIVENNGYLHYNDVLFSSYSKPIYSYHNRFFNSDYVPKVRIGSDVRCLHCGNGYIPAEEGSMFCRECDDRYYVHCDHCGRTVEEDEAIYTANDYVICPECCDAHYFTCECCGEVYPRDYEVYDEEHHDSVCDDCYSYRRERDLI